MRHATIAIVAALALAGVRGAQAQPPADEEPEAAEPETAEAEPETAEAEPGEADEGAEEAEAPPSEAEGPEGSAAAATGEAEAAAGSTAAEAAYYESSEEEGPEEARARAITERGSEKDEDIIPLDVELHGYYRARWNWMHNVPREDPDGAGPIIPGTNDLSFGHQRLRLKPSVVYGPKKDSPIAALRIEIDALDNVVFGDNARVTGVPLFARNPSLTDTDGFELNDSMLLKRAWLEFMVPVGQLRVGRMPSHWGEGLLAHGGHGLAEWGDYVVQSTFDRVLFATRPISIYNAIAKGDSRPTPLIFAFAYDRLVEDPVFDSTDGSSPTYDLGPLRSNVAERSQFPFQYLGERGEQVNEVVSALIWDDQDFGRRASDHLTAGYYFVYRWQNSTNSDIYINDLMWNLQYGLGAGLPSFFTEGEFLNITGKSGALPFTGGCPPGPCNEGEASIFALVARAGVTEPDRWKALLEVGFDSGDDQLLSPELEVRAFHPSYQVGMLMYRVALLAASQRGLGPAGLSALGANGSAWNTKYFWPQARYTIIPGIEVHGGFLLGWAHKRDPLVFGASDDSCGFSGDCFYGWEADLALRVRWGDDDLMWWDTEGALMQPGNALSRSDNPNGLSDDLGDLLWTVQTRVAMQF